MTTYVPQTYNVPIQPVAIPVPVGPAPQPLPSSAGYVVPPKQQTGITASMRSAWDKLTSKAERAWNEETDARFRRYFSFPYTELLYGEFWGEVFTGGNFTPCSVYLSSNWLCIQSKVKDAFHNKLPMLAKFSLRDIVRIQPAIALPSMRGGPPVIQPVVDLSVRPDSVQIFTRDGMVHQFARFYNYEKFVATLNYLWHASTTSYQQQAGGQPSPIYSAPLTQPVPVTMGKEYQPTYAPPVSQTGAPYR